MPRRATLAFAMVSEKPWKLEEVARLFLSVMATFCFGIFVAGLLENIKGGMTPTHRQFLEVLIVMLFLHGAAAIWIVVFLRRSNLSWRQAFGLRPASRLRTIAYGLTAGALAVPVTFMLQWVSGAVMEWLGVKITPEAAVEALQNPDLSLAERITFWAFAVILAPIVEEALFRGVLYPTVKQMGYPRLAIWGTSVLFACSHFDVQILLPLTFFAVVMIILYESSGSLLAPVAAHSMFNTANLLLLIFAKPLSDWIDSLGRAFHHS